jgi:predicted ester cyclase
MSTKEIKALYRRFYGEFNKAAAQGRAKAFIMARYDEMFSANCIIHSATGEDLRGLEELKKRASEHSAAFPDTFININDIVVEGNKAAVRYTVTCTHKAELMGIPATNKKLTMSVIEIDRFVGGKIVEAWEMSDTLGMMQQLGVIPTPKK